MLQADSKKVLMTAMGAELAVGFGTAIAFNYPPAAVVGLAAFAVTGHILCNHT